MPLEALSITNPVLGFRLDPGEPGLLRSARASEATLQVTAQELHNLHRLESEALMRGEVILSSGISFGRAFAGKFLTTTDGLTRVVSRSPRPSVIESEAARGQTEGAPAAGGNPPPDGAAPAAPAAAGAEPPADDRELASEADRLRAELRRLETPGLDYPAADEQPSTADDRAGDPWRPLADVAARRADAARQDRARAVENDLRKVEFERLLRQMQRGLNPAAAGRETYAPAGA